MRRAHVPTAVLDAAHDGGDLILPAEAAHRFGRVLRLAEGARVELFDGGGRIVAGAFSPGPPARVVDVVMAERAAPLPALVVAQGIVKTDKLEEVVRKATELGASEIALVACARSIVKLGDKAAARVERLARVAEDAARQSERAHVPAVTGPIDVDALARRVATFPGISAAGVVGATRPLSLLLDDERFAAGGLLIVVGPEGGLDDDELRLLEGAGAAGVALGAHVLRTETAALAALAAAQAALGRL